MKKTLSFLLFSLILTAALFASGPTQPAGKDSIELKGMVFNNHDRVKNVIVKVYSNNKLIKTNHLGSSNRVRTNLPINAELTIEISADGYHPKRFIFNTHVPNDIERIPNYQFDIDIFREDELAGVNTSILDFPVGIVEYDSRKGEFIRNKKYTKRMKKAYLDLWEESQMSDRSGLE
ncbi:MAG: hypothetical protein RJQ00_09900 [Vicingaceae bacterium]